MYVAACVNVIICMYICMYVYECVHVCICKSVCIYRGIGSVAAVAALVDKLFELSLNIFCNTYFLFGPSLPPRSERQALDHSLPEQCHVYTVRNNEFPLCDIGKDFSMV